MDRKLTMTSDGFGTICIMTDKEHVQLSSALFTALHYYDERIKSYCTELHKRHLREEFLGTLKLYNDLTGLNKKPSDFSKNEYLNEDCGCYIV